MTGIGARLPDVIEKRLVKITPGQSINQIGAQDTCVSIFLTWNLIRLAKISKDMCKLKKMDVIIGQSQELGRGNLSTELSRRDNEEAHRRYEVWFVCTCCFSANL